MPEPGADSSQAESPPAHPSEKTPAQSPEETPAHPPGDGRRSQVVLALAIVVMSILAATMAWRASVADDAAGGSSQLAEQNLLQQQELTASDEAVVLHDIAIFGTYEEYENLGNLLQRAAARAPAAQASALAVRAEQDLEFAQREDALFEVYLPTVTNGIASFDASYARRATLLRDSDLLNLQAPSALRADAAAQERNGLRLTGLAVLFVAALVLFTFAQLTGASISSLFALSGAMVAVVAIVLFISIG
jgi:hypothetical protein